MLEPTIPAWFFYADVLIKVSVYILCTWLILRRLNYFATVILQQGVDSLIKRSTDSVLIAKKLSNETKADAQDLAKKVEVKAEELAKRVEASAEKVKDALRDEKLLHEAAPDAEDRLASRVAEKLADKVADTVTPVIVTEIQSAGDKVIKVASVAVEQLQKIKSEK